MIERWLIFKPDRRVGVTPADRGLGYQEAWLEARDGARLNAWFVPGPRALAWLWFHGRATTMSDRVDVVAAVRQALGVNILIIDYRGFGYSKGRPTEGGLYRDGEAAVQWVKAHPQLGRMPLVIYGHSLGSAVAVEMAARGHGDVLVLESPFVSVQASAAESARGRLVGPLLRARFSSIRKLPNVHIPVLVIHGDQDETVPLKFGLRLFRAANDPKDILAVPGALHADVVQRAGPAYFLAVERFLSRALASEARA